VRGRERRGEGREGRHGFCGDGYPWEGRGGRGGGRRKGENPQYLKCVDANVHVHNYNICIILFLCTFNYFVNIIII